MNRLIVANWKMNGSLRLARDLARAVAVGATSRAVGSEIVLCPPFPYLSVVADVIAGSGLALGAQNVSERGPGAFTGEVAAAMLADLGCRWVIVGHSERRMFYRESSGLVAAKAAAALEAGLQPIICVGETLEDRDTGRTESVLAAQLAAVAPLLRERGSKVVLAYEPVWAIGTGRSASPAQAGEVHAFLRGETARLGLAAPERLRILYGGSLKPENAAALFATPGVDGGLIGGASLKAEDFLDVIGAASGVRPTTGVL
jgi:triosephosphate isomerase